MRCKCKVLSVSGIPASDGSIVPVEVMQDYINSDKCKEALEKHTMLGALTHRARAIAANFPSLAPTLSKTVGKDDSLIIVSEAAPTPTHFIDKLYIEDGWLYAEIKVLEETGLDDVAIQNIRRLKGLLSLGVMPGVSAVIVGYWDNNGSGADLLRKLVQLKGIDVTLNPSWKDASVTEIINETEKEYSEKEYIPSDFKFNGLKVKSFSDLNSLGLSDTPRSSKISGHYTCLKAKIYSADGMVSALDELILVPKEKDFSAASVKDRLRESKLSPRMKFRKMYMSYRQIVRQMGGADKINPEDLKILKSLFCSDVLEIMKTVTPEIEKGKPINTLIGASSLGKNVRVAAQKLLMPYRLAMMEVGKAGAPSKMRFLKIQECYQEFINALLDDVFGSGSLNADEPDLNDENIENEEE